MHAPNFFILGAARSGTTSLYRYVQRHPHVFMSTPKEPVFFEREWSWGGEYYWQKYFVGWSGQPSVGEARTGNLFLPFVPERIHALAPDARLVVSLRNPVERAYSNWRLARLGGREPAGFAEAIGDNLASIQAGRTFAGAAGEELWRERADRPHASDGLRVYVDIGHYAEQLSRYLALFPRRRIKVLWFEDLCRDGPGEVRDVWRFLGLDPQLGAHETIAHNASMNHALGPVVRLSRSLRLNSLLSSRTTSRLRNAAAKLVPDRPMDEITRRRLRQHYEPHTRALEALLGCDLSHWL